jgi:hypothetical protein
VQANFAHRNQNSKVMKRKKLFFKECHLAGRQYQLRRHQLFWKLCHDWFRC